MTFSNTKPNMYNVEIRPVLNGWLAQVGCQTLAYTSKEALLKDLDAYLTNPREMTEKFLASAVNREWISTGGPVPAGGGASGATCIIPARPPEPAQFGSPQLAYSAAEGR